MERYDIINALIAKNNFKSYLEIGTEHGNTFTRINIGFKECVDPVKAYVELTYHMTSNAFFEQNKKTYDIIFVDGLHTEEQTLIDINNSLKVLNEGGIIVAHDCLPPSEEMTKLNWCGTSYRAAMWHRCYNDKVLVQVVDAGGGCGIIKRQKNVQLFNRVPFEQAREYSYYAANKNELMNVITADEFIKQYIT